MQGVQDDIGTMQPTVDEIVSVSAVLRSRASPSFAGHLQADVGSMRTRWAAVMDASRRHTARLTAAVDEARAAFDRLAALEAWLDDVTHAHLSREYTVHSDAELQQFTNNFQVYLYAFGAVSGRTQRTQGSCVKFNTMHATQGPKTANASTLKL